MDKINYWSGNIVNHFWFSCRTCNDDLQTLKVGLYSNGIVKYHASLQEKWVGLLHHVTNEHEWIFGQCKHEPLTGPPTDTNGQQITYFRTPEPAFQVLRKIVTDRAWMESLKSYTRFRYCYTVKSNIICL